MDFELDEDQLLLQKTVGDFLARECTPETVRAAWDADAGVPPELWAKLADLGVPGLLVSEEHEGMGRDEIDAALLFEEMGRAALPGPVVETAVVAPLLLREFGGELAERWPKRIATGEALVALRVDGRGGSPLVADADRAQLVLLLGEDAILALDPADAELVRQPAHDPSRRLFTLRFERARAQRVAEGERARELAARAFDRGALACAAQQLGVADRLLELAVRHAGERRQFGAPIGSFQAVKHMLANAKVALEYARPGVHRAAFSVARDLPGRSLHVSMAKLQASEAAQGAARTALQVHGAIGYTFEHDLHLWMRRAGSLEQAFGRNDFHRRRIEEAILAPGARLGPGSTFAAP